MTRRLTYLVVLALVGVAMSAVGALGSSTATRVDIPSAADIAVDINGGPPQIGNIPSDGMNSCNWPSSGARPPFTINCPFDYSYNQSAVPMNGTATWTSKNLSGSFQASCDFNVAIKGKAAVAVSATGSSSQTFDFGGSGTQACSWTMSFSGATLTGTLNGTMAFGQSDATTGTFKGDFTVTVLSGTGQFQGAVGSGSFTENETMDLAGKAPAGAMPSQSEIAAMAAAGAASSGAPSSIPSGSIPPGVSIPAGVTIPTSKTVRHLSAAPAGSAMHLKLSQGVARATFVIPKTVASLSSYALHVAAAPGSACTATATKAGTSVDLGKATASKTGAAIFPGKLATKLKTGQWKLAASCTLSGAKAAATGAAVIK